MHNKVTKRTHLTFYSMMFTLKYEQSVQLRVLVMFHLKANLHLILKLKVLLRLQLSWT